jgi:hypothetical protein
VLLAVQFKTRLESFELVEHPLLRNHREAAFREYRAATVLCRDSRDLRGIVTTTDAPSAVLFGRMVEKDVGVRGEVPGRQFRVAASASTMHPGFTHIQQVAT